MYFNTPGPENTGETVKIAVREAVERLVPCIIVASNTGATARALVTEGQAHNYGGNIICVPHVYGFKEGGKNELSDEERATLEKQGVKICVAAHALSGAERALSRKFQGAYPVEIIAQTLRMLGQGTKVCVEIAVMALDAGLIPYGKPVIALGGSGRGADTAAILTPGYSSSVFDTKIHEILCKPHLGS
jgi:hypothetical protein